MGKLWRDLAISIVSGLLIVSGGAVLSHVAPDFFFAVLWGLVSAALISIIILTFIVLRRTPKRVPAVTPENVESSIRVWLDSFRLGVRKIDETETHFSLIVSHLDKQIVVRRYKTLDRYVTVQITIVLSPKARTVYEQLSIEERNIFAARLLVEVSRTSMVAMMDLETPNGGITLARRLPITENLTEESFMSAVDAVDSARIQVLRTLELMLLDVTKNARIPTNEEKGARIDLATGAPLPVTASSTESSKT